MDELQQKQNKEYKEQMLKMSDAFCSLAREYQMDVLESFLQQDLAGRQDVSILDACCGQGRLLYQLALFDPRQCYTGFDYTKEFVDTARERFAKQENITCLQADIYDLPTSMHKQYAITILYKTLAWIPGYRAVLESLFSVTTEKIYITSPVYEGDIDFEIKAAVHPNDLEKSSYHTYYIYSIPGLKAACESLGAKAVHFHDLALPFPLEAPSNPDVLQTYTVETAEGKYLELTNIIKLDWKMIEIIL